MSVDVTLVNPPYPIKRGHHHPPFITVGIAYLGAVLEKAGYTVNVIDCQALKLTYAEFESEIAKHKPKMIGLTSTTLTYKSALKIIEIAKRVHPESLTVLGGCHATFWDDKALEECKALDMVVRREGEYTVLEIMNKLKENKPINDVLGTTFRNNGEIIRTAERPTITNLDELPFPAYHLFPLQAFERAGRIIFPVLASRGCVYCCDFCTAVRMFGRKHRVRSPKSVVDEMEYVVKKYGAKQFSFYDDLFTLDEAWVTEISRDIRRRKLNVTWDCETRLDMISKELLLEMRKGGCNTIWFSLESGNQRVLDAMGKGFKIEQTLRAFKWAQEIGMMTIANVVLGFPGETVESAWETVKFVKKVGPDDVGYNIATPYPGTAMYEQVKKNGWLKDYDFDSYDTATPTFETPTLSMKDLQEIHDKAYQQFYLRPMYVLRMLAKGGSYRRAAARTSFARLLRALGYKFHD
jgi:anaerobic magnesium-protoporphyrin IX monomethyl ester cyclase